MAYPRRFWLHAMFIVTSCMSKLPKRTDTEIHRETDFKQIKQPGDIMVGGLFPVHEDGSPEGRHCGTIKLDKGVQRMEAMLYAIDKINQDPQLLPGIKLGVHILDTCHQDTHALEQTLELVRETFAVEYNKNHLCRDGSSPIAVTPPKPVVAVIGAASSQVSAMVSNVLRLFKIPQISYSSTSVELSDKSRFGYFSRVVPPDNFQARAMADVVKKLGWNFVAILADEGSYGEPAYEAFHLVSSKKGVCISIYEKIRRYYRDGDFLNLMAKLSKARSTGVVLFCHEDNIKKILKAVVELNLVGRFAWIGSDNWGTKRDVVINYASASLGAITVQPKSTVDEGFNEYFTSLRPGTNLRNNWFNEFWEKQFECSLVLDSCRKRSLKEFHVQEDYVSSVIDAVYLFAHALHKQLSDSCGLVPFIHCNASHKVDGEALLKYIRTVRFIGAHGDEITLDSKGDRMAKYNIYQFQGLTKYYVAVGEWKGQLKLNKSQIQTGFPEGVIPKSTCSEPCKEDEFKTIITGQCCWTCLPCNMETAIMPNKSSCIACQIGFLPNGQKNECVPMIPQHIEWSTWWAILPATISTVGIVASLFVAYTFIKYNNTPLIKASGRELCYVMLCGIIACYLMTFPLLNPTTTVTCGFLRMGIGISTCTIYAAVFTKTLRLARIFNTEAHQLRSLRFLSPGAQIIISCFLISIQAFTALVWMIMEPPEVVVLYPDRMTAVLSCKGAKVMFPISMIYNILLIILCTIYAFKTRKIPENFNETKYIGFTMYATCIVWLAFIPIYFGTNQNFKIQTTTLCICVGLCGTVALCCFFAPKMYIVLFQPEKNKARGKNERFRTAQLMREHVFNLQSLIICPDNPIEENTDRRLSITNEVTSLVTVTGVLNQEESEKDGDNTSRTLLEETVAPTELTEVDEPLKCNGNRHYRASVASAKNSYAMLLFNDDQAVLNRDCFTELHLSNEADSGVEQSIASPVPKIDIQKVVDPSNAPNSIWLTGEKAKQFMQGLKDVTKQEGTMV